MDIAALVLSTISLLASCACLVLLLAKRFSTHRVEYVTPSPTDTFVEEELSAAPPGEDPTPPVPAQAPKRWTLEQYQRQAALQELERHVNGSDEYDDF